MREAEIGNKQGEEFGAYARKSSSWGKIKAVEEKNEERNFHGGGWGETESTIPRSEQGSPLTK